MKYLGDSLLKANMTYCIC